MSEESMQNQSWEPTLFFAHRMPSREADRGERYAHFYKSRRLMGLCGDHPIVVLEVREAEDAKGAEYWGWRTVD